MLYITTCVDNPGDINVGETIGELVDIDNAVDTVTVEVIAHLPLDSLVLGPTIKSGLHNK